MTEAQPRGALNDGFREADVEALDRTMKGSVLQPSDDGYDEARTIWNAMIDRRPALISRAITGSCCRFEAAATTSPATQSATTG
jgi:hypothetical protein